MNLGYFLLARKSRSSPRWWSGTSGARCGFEACVISITSTPGTVNRARAVRLVRDRRDLAGVRPAITTAVTCRPGAFTRGGRSGRRTFGSAHRRPFRLGSAREALNEHVIGARWPTAAVRLEMLEERWRSSGSARCGDLPSPRAHYHSGRCPALHVAAGPVPIYVSGFVPKAIDLLPIAAGSSRRQTSAEDIKRYRAGGGKGPVEAGSRWLAPRSGTRRSGRRIGSGQPGLPGELAQVLPSPSTSSRPRNWSPSSQIEALMLAVPDGRSTCR